MSYWEKCLLGRNVSLREKIGEKCLLGRKVLGRNVLGRKDFWGETSEYPTSSVSTMIEIELYILSSIRLVLQAMSCGIFTLIWMYLNIKALGMQSLINVMIKDYIRIIVANFIISDLTTIKIQDKYHSYLALTLLNIDHFMVNAMLAQILLTTVIRFMIIKRSQHAGAYSFGFFVLFFVSPFAQICISEHIYEIYQLPK